MKPVVTVSAGIPDAIEMLAAALSAPGAEIEAAAQGRRPPDLAGAIERMPVADGLRVLRALPVRRQAAVFGYLRPKIQARLALGFDQAERAALVAAMNHDERADLYKSLSKKGQEALIGVLAQAEREDLRRLASYEEGTAGSIMTSDYAFLWPRMTAPEALEAVRRQAVESETVYALPVVSTDGYQLLGILSLRDLLLAGAKETVSDIMETAPITVRADASREEAARTIARYDLLALPVVDGEGRLVGIVTEDDALDVVEKEATEDALRGSSVGEIDGDMLETPLRQLYGARIVWLVLLVFGSMFSGAGLAAFEDTISAHMALLFFLPLLIGSGGNAGAQSATLTVRALATGDVRPADYLRMLLREMAVSVALGLTMALAIGFVGLLRADLMVVTVVSCSMVLIVFLGALLGLTLPFLLQRLRFDPATASGPLVTSICDVMGVLIYFGIATLLLPM